MDNQPATAALRFADQLESLYGTVTHMSQQDINIRLHAPPSPSILFATGTGAGLIVLARDMMYTTATEVVAAKHGDVRLQFTSGITATQRRRHIRVAYELGVSYRLIQDNGCYGSWRNGFSRDISSGGMCLVIETGFEVPRHIEMLFMLPDQSSDSLIEGVASGPGNGDILKLVAPNRPSAVRTPNKERPVKALARVSNHRMLADGRLALGLAFSTVSPADELRLTRFLNAPWHTIV